MDFPQKLIRLNNGTVCLLRSPGRQDAVAVQEHRIHVREETDLFFRTTESTNLFDLGEQAAFLEACRRFPLCCMIVACINNRLIGMADVTMGFNMTLANFSVSIRKEFWGQGLGSQLLQGSMQAARTLGYRRMVLSVHKDNAPAIALYKKFGFTLCHESEHEWKMQRDLSDIDPLT